MAWDIVGLLYPWTLIIIFQELSLQRNYGVQTTVSLIEFLKHELMAVKLQKKQ